MIRRIQEAIGDAIDQSHSVVNEYNNWINRDTKRRPHHASIRHRIHPTIAALLLLATVNAKTDDKGNSIMQQ